MKTKLIEIECLPCRIGKSETAKVLGFKNHDIPILVKKKMLKPLGKPSERAPKYFSTVAVLENGHDAGWMDKASKAVNDHWKDNHAKRKK